MSPSKTFLRLSQYFLKYRWRILASLVSVAVMSLADAATAMLSARFFDALNVIGQQVAAGKEILLDIPIRVFDRILYLMSIRGTPGSFELIYMFAIAVMIVTAAKMLFMFVRELLMSSVREKILMRFRIDLFETVVMLPVRYFDTNKTGYVMSRITNDVNNLDQSLNLMIEISQNVVYAIIFAATLLYTNWQLTLVTVLVFGVSGQVARRFGDRIRSYSSQLTNTLADISAFLQEKISAVRLVKSFTREDDEKRSFRTKAESNYHYAMKIARTVAFLNPTNEIFNTMAVAVLVVFCGYLFIRGSMTIESMLFFLIVMVYLAKPVKALGESVARIQKTLVSAGYIFEILDLKTESLRAKAESIAIPNGMVEFQDVSFSYDGETPALNGISFRVEAGEKIALVGPSGGGKTTLINLIPRFYEPSGGSILIDGKDTGQMHLTDLRSQIAIVPQDVVLFSGSVGENIRYGRLEATEEEVKFAAEAANAARFIENLDRGYGTEVGERGVQLSGGQRQRIAIARAILRNPRILLLDEATSALDTESELMVQEALNRLMEGRTSFIIAHRLSTVSHCDRIFVLDRGSVVEIGTHDELLRNESGLYKRLHSLQFTDNAN